MLSCLAGLDLIELQRSRSYDAMMRAPILLWSVVLVLSSIANLVKYACSAHPALSPVVYDVNIATRLSVIIYPFILARAVLARIPASGKAYGIEPRISATIGTFLITTILLFPRRELSPTESIVSTFLIFAGNGLAALVLVQLSGSFSIMAEARQLVTSGPYRIIRHPLYLAEEIAVFGTLIQFFSAWTMGLIAVQLAFQLRRMRIEEKLLQEMFPAYLAYKDATSRLIPGIY